MNKNLILLTLLACGSCAPLSQTNNLLSAHDTSVRRASAFIYDPAMPPIVADGFLYDPTMPALHASNFIPNNNNNESKVHQE